MTMRAWLLLLLSLHAWSCGASFIGGRNRRRLEREERATAAVCATSCGAAGFTVASKLRTSYQPGGMAYYRLQKPMFDPSRRIAVGLAAASVGLVCAAGVQSGNDPVSAVLRRAGAALVDIEDDVREWWRERTLRRERAERDEWLRANSKPAHLHVPN